MSENDWIPINDYPGDQLWDSPGRWWGEIGKGSAPNTWSWTIVCIDDNSNTVELDGGHAGSETEAKQRVESWQPRKARIMQSRAGIWITCKQDGDNAHSFTWCANHTVAVAAADAWVRYTDQSLRVG